MLEEINIFKTKILLANQILITILETYHKCNLVKLIKDIKIVKLLLALIAKY